MILLTQRVGGHVKHPATNSILHQWQYYSEVGHQPAVVQYVLPVEPRHLLGFPLLRGEWCVFVHPHIIAVNDGIGANKHTNTKRRHNPNWRQPGFFPKFSNSSSFDAFVALLDFAANQVQIARLPSRAVFMYQQSQSRILRRDTRNRVDNNILLPVINGQWVSVSINCHRS